MDAGRRRFDDGRLSLFTVGNPAPISQLSITDICFFSLSLSLSLFLETELELNSC